MGRPSDAKAKILAAAQALIELHGYSAIGVAEICKSAGVPKGSFYYFFDSKDALVLAVVDLQWEAQRAMWAGVLGGEEPPLDRLRRLFELTAGTLREGQESGGSVAGCLFGNLALELSNSRSVAIRGRLREIFDIQAAMIEAVLVTAQERGDIRVGDTGEAARSVVAQLEGHVMFAKLHNDVGRMDPMWSNSLALLDAVSDPRSDPRRRAGSPR